MIVRYIRRYIEVIEINTNIQDQTISLDKDKYSIYKDKKWIKFCKEHNFNPIKDSRGKIYDLYLRLCAEGIL